MESVCVCVGGGGGGREGGTESLNFSTSYQSLFN